MEKHDAVNAVIQKTGSLECTEDPPHPTTHSENEFTLVTRVLSPKPININAFKNTILKAWSPKKKVSTNTLQPNNMAFIFEDENDTNKIMNLSWSFRDMQVVVQRWPPDKALQELDLNKTLIWVHAYGLPVNLMNQSTAEYIRNTIGTFIKTDLHTPAHKWKKALRIQVEVQIQKPLFTFVSVPRQNTSNIPIGIRYERISEFCFKCGVLGHKFLTCNDTLNLDSMDISTNGYGPWTKSENSHIPNPLFSNISNSHSIPNSDSPHIAITKSLPNPVTKTQSPEKKSGSLTQGTKRAGKEPINDEITIINQTHVTSLEWQNNPHLPHQQN